MKKEKIYSLLKKEWYLPKAKKIESLIHSFSFTEKIIFFIVVFAFGFSSLFLLIKLNEHFLVEVPHRGGTLTEGIIGTARFINPLIAISPADRDMVALIYSGLLKHQSDGSLTNDLSKSYEISEDGLAYTFTIREDAYFHDGVEVTADDVVFTIQKAKDPNLKSPKRSQWEGVSVEKVDEKTVKFTLNQPYGPFIESATLGILPKHIWEKYDSEQFPFNDNNIEPVGSGPFKIQKVKRGKERTEYHLKPFEKYTLGAPFIKKIVIKTYSEEEINDALIAVEKGQLDSLNGISPEKAKELSEQNFNVESYPSTRIFGVFFNQNQAPIFSNKEVREALDTALDKERIVKEVLSGYGKAIDSPIPSDTIYKAIENRKEKAKEILEKNKWQLNEEGIFEKEIDNQTVKLEFEISTLAGVPEIEKTANLIKEEWQAIGASVQIKFFEENSLNQDVIRPRNYEALFLGILINRDFDLYPFWHSSQRNDPGVNISLFTDITADKILEDARLLTNREERMVKYLELEKEIKNDIPAVFVYSPEFIYVFQEKINKTKIEFITMPFERFLNVHEWYKDTKKIWIIFNK